MSDKSLIKLKNDLIFGDVILDEKILQHASNSVVYEKELLDQDSLKRVEQHDIITSVNDNRLYRGLEFPHQLKVVLITDPSAEKAAAALRVAAGYSLDPNAKPGLAYLFQRVLYLTDEGQQQKLFKNFVRENGGTVNAETHMNHAMYNFDINPNKFSEAFIQFTEFFTKFPDLSEDVIKKEYPNIKPEIKKNELNESMNMIKFFKWIRHYYEIDIKEREKRFPNIIGTEKESIGLKQFLQLFYINYYNACTMQLCILGRESLDELENMVTSTFYRTKQNTIPTTSPISRSTSVYKICFTPQDESNKLILLFEYSLQHQINANHFFDYAFKYDGKDSLLSALKTKEWVNSITPGRVDSEELYSITFDLTNEGIKHIDNIMMLFLKYINMLRNNDDKLKRMYMDYKDISSLKFRFAKKETPLKYVTNIVAETYGKLRNVLQGKYCPIKWHQKAMLAIFDPLILPPYRMSLYVTSKEFKDKTTKDFGNYKYTIENISQKTYTKWMDPHCSGELSEPLYDVELNVPPVNLFIPTMISVKPHDEYKDKFPTLIHDTTLLNLWYKKDNEFNEPNAVMIFNINCLGAYLNDANLQNSNLKNTNFRNFTVSQDLYIQILNESLSEYKFPAAMVNLFWELENNGYQGIKLKIYGFDNKQHVLLEKILDRMINFNIKEPNFEDICSKYCYKEDKKFQRSKLHQEAESYLPLLLTNYNCDYVEVPKAFNHVSFEAFCNFASSVLDSVHIEGLIHGNVTIDEARNVVRIIEDKFAHAAPHPRTKIDAYRDIKLEDNMHLMCYNSMCQIHSSKSSNALILYQIKRQTIKEDVLLDFIREIINIPCCNKLKEKYPDLTVNTGVYRLNSTQNLKILLKGENYIKDIEGNMEDNIEEQVEEFMLSMKDYITNMPVEEVEAIKTSITESYHNKEPKTLDDLSNAYWDEITETECIFNRTDVILDILKAITLKDLSDFFEKLVDKKTPKLSVYVSVFDEAPTWYRNKSVYTSERTSKSKRTIEHEIICGFCFRYAQVLNLIKKISIN